MTGTETKRWGLAHVTSRTVICQHKQQRPLNLLELALVQREALRGKSDQALLIQVHPERVQAGDHHIHPQVILHIHNT